MFKKVWSDPVWSKVIAGAILTGLASLVAYLAGWWPNIVSFVSEIGSLGASSTRVPNWLLALLILAGTVVLVLVGVTLWALLFSRDAPPSFRSYTEDVVFGIRWRWRYDTGGVIYNLVSFCPKCDYQIFPRNVAAFQPVDRLQYKCEDCGAVVREFEIAFEEIESRVMRHIQKNLRTGAWRELVNAQRHANTKTP